MTASSASSARFVVVLEDVLGDYIVDTLGRQASICGIDAVKNRAGLECACTSTGKGG